jgi:hypothetical protein
MALFKFLTITIIILFSFNIADAQARSAVAFGGGPAFPLASGYKVSSTWALQTNVRLGHKVTAGLLLGIENIVSEKKGRYNGYYFEGSPREASLLMLGLLVRYYITANVFATLVPTLYVGGDDASSSGGGGTAGVGYDLLFDNHNSIELLLHADKLKVYDDPVTVAGLRIAYKFNFGKR